MTNITRSRPVFQPSGARNRPETSKPARPLRMVAKSCCAKRSVAYTRPRRWRAGLTISEAILHYILAAYASLAPGRHAAIPETHAFVDLSVISAFDPHRGRHASKSAGFNPTSIAAVPCRSSRPKGDRRGRRGSTDSVPSGIQASRLPDSRGRSPTSDEPIFPVQDGERREGDLAALKLVPKPGAITLDNLLAGPVSADQEGGPPARPAIDANRISMFLRPFQGRPQIGPAPRVDDGGRAARVLPASPTGRPGSSSASGRRSQAPTSLAAVLAKARFWQAHASDVIKERQVKVLKSPTGRFRGASSPRRNGRR